MNRLWQIDARATLERGFPILLGVCAGILGSVAFGLSGARTVALPPNSASPQTDSTRTLAAPGVSKEARIAWTFAQGLPDSWTAVPGTAVSKGAGEVRVRTTRLRQGYQLTSEPVIIEPGSYRAGARVGVTGGLSLLVLDVGRNRFLASALRRGRGGGARKLSASLRVRKRVRVRIILANFSIAARSSDWRVREVSLEPVRTPLIGPLQ